MFMVNCLLAINQYAVDNIRSLVKGALKTMAKSGLKATGSTPGCMRPEQKHGIVSFTELQYFVITFVVIPIWAVSVRMNLNNVGGWWLNQSSTKSGQE